MVALRSYIDASAVVKLVVREVESDALRSFVASRELVTSDLTRAELLRAVRRVPALAGTDSHVHSVLDACLVLPVDELVLERAGRLAPATLRTLDAIHLATAVRVRGDIDSIVTYDGRLAEAAEQHGLRVEMPV